MSFAQLSLTDSAAHRRAKIVATLGPASSSPQMLDALIAAGVDVARLNFSHGDHATHAAACAAVRAASACSTSGSRAALPWRPTSA